MFHLFRSHPGLGGVSHRRVCPSRSAGSDSDRQLHQPAGLLVQRAGIVASLSELAKRPPDLWKPSSDPRQLKVSA
jgi:hypothetical protein